MCLSLFARFYDGAALHFSFPKGARANEESVLCWIHFVSGIIWIGLLYFFNLVGFRRWNSPTHPCGVRSFR